MVGGTAVDEVADVNVLSFHTGCRPSAQPVAQTNVGMASRSIRAFAPQV
jgi:hypothetical protein